MSMTQEALKLALEALLHAHHEDEAHPRTLEAITAIKEALAQLEHDYRTRYDRGCYKCGSHYCPADCPEPLHLVPQQPQVQPCAGRNCGSTNPNLHSAECFEDYQKATGMAQPDAYGYASRLATHIWQKHYIKDAPQWKPLDKLMGVLTQIDNMTAGLTRLAQPEQKPVTYSGNGTAGREADVQPTGFFFQMPKPIGEVYGWHGSGKGQPMCRFDTTEAEMPVGTKLYIALPQRTEQEPVGEVLDERGEVDWISFVPPAGTSLYTTPPQRTERPVDCERCNRLEEQAYDLVGKLRVANIKLSMQPQRTEQEPVKIVQYNCKCGRTMKFESVHGVVAPQRTWVGLTDDEIDALHMQIKVQLMGTFDTKDIYRAIEARLKEKNT